MCVFLYNIVITSHLILEWNLIILPGRESFIWQEIYSVCYAIRV